jgi:hypothetical protein
MTTIEPNGIYSPAEVAARLGVSERAIRNAIRRGELRVSKRARTHYILGEWVLLWIEAGTELKPGPRLADLTEDPDAPGGSSRPPGVRV